MGGLSKETLQLIATLVSIAVLGVATVSFFMSTEILGTARKSLDAVTRPPYLIMELQPETSGNVFNDIDMTYLSSGVSDRREDKIRINLWNTGAQVAENVTVSLTFSPSNGNIVDTQTMQKCRDIVCNTSPEGASSMVKIRAIEAGGFYTIVASFALFPQEIAKMEEPLYMTIGVDNPTSGHEQKIAQTYRVDARL